MTREYEFLKSLQGKGWILYFQHLEENPKEFFESPDIYHSRYVSFVQDNFEEEEEEALRPHLILASEGFKVLNENIVIKKLAIVDQVIEEDTINHILSHFPSLDSLVLVGLGLRKVPKTVFTLEFLKHLHLNNNSLKSIPAEISQLKHLKVLDLANNFIKDLPKSISNLKHLTTLSLRENPITILGEELRTLSKSLTFLDLDGTDIDTSPPYFSEFPPLCSLSINRTQVPYLPYMLYYNIENEYSSEVVNRTVLISNSRIRCIDDIDQ